MVFNSHNLLIPAGNLSQAGPSMCPSGTQCRSCLLERGLMSEVAAALSPARMRCVKWSGTSNVDWSPAWVSTRCSAYFTSSWCLRWPSPGRITLHRFVPYASHSIGARAPPRVRFWGMGSPSKPARHDFLTPKYCCIAALNCSGCSLFQSVGIAQIMLELD